MQTPSRHIRHWWIAIWIALLVGAFFVDRTVAQWVSKTVPLDKSHQATRVLIYIMRLPGNYGFTIGLACVVAVIHPKSWRAAGALALSGFTSGINGPIKWIVGRHRPVRGIEPFTFHPFPGGIAGLFHSQAGLSFPSGDATCAFTTAASLSILFPRWAPAYYFAAAIVALERVMENAHYVSEVVAGAGIGIILGLFFTRLVMGRLEPDPPGFPVIDVSE
ncbi:MAG TPA: phosphatase PAP2 family protein [Humisphaera sp.]|nr:phosphatase PAP2 family protein [Humisphaera sp.]